jgi:hypothetical protein
VDCGLLIAAGGGGDAIAAAIVSRAIDPARTRPPIATYSWDRLLIDPLPGPRDPSSFVGLERVGERNHRVTAQSEVVAPAGSTLPRLAAELDADLFLLDPRGGAQGLAGQLIELTRLLGTSAVTIVDVGGDILARGDEPTLRSPLADSLVLAATAGFAQARVLITGAGIDGELPEDLVLERYAQLRAKFVHRLTSTDVDPFRSLFDWHPSEATGILCAAAAGTRGTAEIRDQGFPVVLSDHTPDVHALPAQRVRDFNRIAQRVEPARSLQEAEATLLATGRRSEIDYERRKAKQRGEVAAAEPPAEPTTQALADQLAEIRGDAAQRGVDFITLRGLAERLALPGNHLAELQHHLYTRHGTDYAAPLWKVHPGP